MELDDLLGPVDDQIRHRITRLDGTAWYAFSLWALPNGSDFAHLPEGWPEEYMQTAGAAAALTVEFRRIANGVAVQHVVGRDVRGEPQRAVEISWGEHTVPVFENEVLSAQEAIKLFLSYLHGDALFDGYTERPR